MEHSINVCFSTTSSKISRLIRWFTKSEVSHCYITFIDPVLGTVVALDVDWIGVIVVPWKNRMSVDHTLIARYSINVPEEAQLAAIRELVPYLGCRYDFSRLPRLALKRSVKKIEHPLSNANRFICSEYITRFLNSCGAADIVSPESRTPADVYEYVMNHPEMFNLIEGIPEHA